MDTEATFDSLTVNGREVSGNNNNHDDNMFAIISK